MSRAMANAFVFASSLPPMAPSPTVVDFPSRFYLRADNNKFVARSAKSQNPGYEKYYIECGGDSADAPETVFEAAASDPNSKAGVAWKHVERGQLVLQTMLLWILPGGRPWETYFHLHAVDVKNSQAAIYVTLHDPTGAGSSVPQDAYLVRQDRDGGGGRTLPNALSATGKSIAEATIFRVYDSALRKVWTEVVLELEKAKLEDVVPFESGKDVLDNREYDQTVTFHPSLKYSQSIQSNWASSSSFGFTESISVTGKIPFASQVEVGFTAEQTFQTSEGGNNVTTTERQVTVDVPVPPHTKVQVFVVGIRGRVTIPFRHKEVATYADGSTKERVLYNGVCKSVSSTGTEWKVKYVGTNNALLSRNLPKLL